jgi:hypothetical protein
MLNTCDTKRRRAPVLALLVGLFAGSIGVPHAAFADVKAANDLYKDIAPTLRSDEVLLPLLAAMAPAPKAVATRESAAMLLAGMQGFDEAAAWAQGDAQKAVLEGLKKVTQEQDFRKAFGFGQPYGADAVDPNLVRAGLYTEFGDPALLPGARFLYLSALENLICLANVEANRLLGEKKSGEALLVLTNLLYFTRQMCDRQFFAEASWGLTAFSETCERLRDVAYLDQSMHKALTVADLEAVLKRFDISKVTTAYVDIERMQFPKAEQLGFRQVADRLFGDDGSPNDAQFGSTLARLRSSNRPLRLFSEAGKWTAAAVGHAPKAETLAAGDRVFSDWRTRWELPWFDRQQSNTQEYVALNSSRFAAIKATVPDLHELYMLRQVARIELVGVRHALAVVGAIVERGNIPNLLVAIRPRWVTGRTDQDIDPLNATIVDRGARPPLRYFVPAESGTPILIVLANEVSFNVTLKNDTFVLYSMGSDYSDQQARRIQNTPKKIQVLADYLLYPPVESLYRQSLIDLGQLK